MSRIPAPLAQVVCLSGVLWCFGCEAPRETPSGAQAPQTAPQIEDNAAMTDQGQDFLANNAAREEVITTDSGLQYEVLVSGDGRALPPRTW